MQNQVVVKMKKTNSSNQRFYRLSIVIIALIFLSNEAALAELIAKPRAIKILRQKSKLAKKRAVTKQTRHSIEQTLLTGRITHSEEFDYPGANTGKRIIKIGKQKVLTKPPSEIQMLEIKKGTEPIREVETYKTAKRFFGKMEDLPIPVTVLRKFKGRHQSFQEWVRNGELGKEFIPTEYRSLTFEDRPGEVKSVDVLFGNYKKDMHPKLLKSIDVESVHMQVVLDFVLNNPDRRPDNWFLVKEKGKFYVKGIDHGQNWVVDRNIRDSFMQGHDIIYLTVQLAKAGKGFKIAPRVATLLNKVNVSAWIKDMKKAGFNSEEIDQAVKRFKLVKLKGLRAIAEAPMKFSVSKLRSDAKRYLN